MTLKLQQPDVLSLVGSMRKEGQLEEARELLMAAVAWDREARQLWEQLGLVAFELRELPAAQSALELASLLGPLTAEAQVALAKCYDDSEHPEAAAAIYRHVAAMPELDTALLEPLAAGLGRAGELELALDVCRRAARLMPDNPDPLVGIVHYMRRLRRPLELIVPAMYRAHQLEPQRSEYRISLAWMLYEMGRGMEAADLLGPVPCVDFTCVRCLTLMQRIFEHIGDEQRAAVCRAQLTVIVKNDHGSREKSGSE